MAKNWLWKLALRAFFSTLVSLSLAAQMASTPSAGQIQLQRSRNFLSQRRAGSSALAGSGQNPAELLRRARIEDRQATADSSSSLTSPWTSVGPSPLQTSAFGLVSGRVTSIAVDSADSSGNTVYVGTTGGGVWKSTNAAGNAGSVSFAPLTDTLPNSNGCATPPVPSLSIGAVTVQPGGTGVILAGTGDPNDSLDSYYGMGLLRSDDGGRTWCMISEAVDNLIRKYTFVGEGFSGFAWSGATPGLVVAAVSSSTEGLAVDAGTDNSFAGLYYSTDTGKTWYLATITDGPGATVQASNFSGSGNPGSAATSVTWNPVRQRFYAAVRYHGYYESSDGMTFTRLQNQPGVNLSTLLCPANAGVGSPNCPIFRGTIVTQPVTGDMFAITVDHSKIDQGLWQDVCNGSCGGSAVTFSQQINDAAIESSGSIPEGDYDLSLAAVPAQQDTLLFVGTQDLYRCSLLNGCVWRNTTNTDGCAAAKVAPSLHAIDATFGVTRKLMYFGTDGGLWRTTDTVNQQQPRCSADDAAHFDNLNGGLGSIAEVGAFSVHPQDASVLMAAMGPFGTAASSHGGGAWEQVLDGEGDYNAIDPTDPQNWYATSAAPVAINRCTAGESCNKTDFGSPVIGNAQVGNDGYGLTGTAPWILDPQNTANIIVGTCRVWRGPANGQGWLAADAISVPLDKDQQNGVCNGNAQIRSLAASGGSGTKEVVYAGMAGGVDGGATIAGHVYSATVDSASQAQPAWSDWTLSPLINIAGSGFNPGGFDVSSIYVDPHDPTGNTVYVTLQGFATAGFNVAQVFRSQDGGAHWIALAGALPNAPANSVLVDPNDAETVYVATDTGVYATQNVDLCTNTNNPCWSRLGTGLPYAPVMQLKYVNFGSTGLLLASTYGRGIWQIPLLTAGTQMTSATLTPSSLSFAPQQQNTTSGAQTMTVTNNGGFTLTVSHIAVSENFTESDNCTQPLAPAATCAIQVSFAPQQTGAIQGTLTVYGNLLSGGQVTAALSGTGLKAGNIVLLPGSLAFGNALVGTTTKAQNITISNTGEVGVGLQSPTITGDFQISANTCPSSLAPNFGCTVAVVFAPKASGTRTGVFSIKDDEGTQTVQLAGSGQLPATANLSPMSLTFPAIMVGEKSSGQVVTLTNNGDVALSQIAVSISGDFTAENDCTALLVGHTSCAILVTFVPEHIGQQTGALTVSTALGVQNVTLSGSGLAPPGVSVLPASVDFGPQGVSIASSQQSIAITNNGGFALTGLSASLTGAADFSIAANSCPASGILPPGTSCNLGLTFTPSQAGLRSGTLNVKASNLFAPFTVPLAGTGEDFQLLVQGSTSAVIVTGQTATYHVQVISLNGSTGTLTMGCSGAPQNASCAISPSPLSFGSGGGSATITVTTGVSSTSSLITPFKVSLAFAALLPCVFWGLRKRSNLLRGMMLCLVSLALLTSVACGTHASGGSSSSGGGDGPSGPTTPSGVYTVNITAAMGGLEKNVSVTLTVQ